MNRQLGLVLFQPKSLFTKHEIDLEITIYDVV